MKFRGGWAVPLSTCAAAPVALGCRVTVLLETQLLHALEGSLTTSPVFSFSFPWTSGRTWLLLSVLSVCLLGHVDVWRVLVMSPEQGRGSFVSQLQGGARAFRYCCLFFKKNDSFIYLKGRVTE